MCLYASICQYMAIYTNICQYMPVYGNIYQYMPVYASICQYMRIYANICEYMRIYGSICPTCLPERTRLSWFDCPPHKSGCTHSTLEDMIYMIYMSCCDIITCEMQETSIWRPFDFNLCAFGTQAVSPPYLKQG